MERENLKGRIDWITTLIPFVIVLAMMLVFMLIRGCNLNCVKACS